MSLNIKNSAVEKLAREVAELTGESKTEAIRRALEERKNRLTLLRQGSRPAWTRRALETEIWTLIPPGLLGRGIPQAEQDAILGFELVEL